MENYTSDSSDSDANSNKVLDLAYLLLEPHVVEKNLEEIVENGGTHETEKLILHHNQLNVLPANLKKFRYVRFLDVSNNGLTALPDVLEHCPLSALIAKNNFLRNDTLPKQFTASSALREINLSGNHLEHFPEQVFDFPNLKYLYLGGNKIRSITKNIWKLTNLQVLALGGNELVDVPSSLGRLKHLQALVLCDNLIESLPSNIAKLHNLKSLLLHKNRLRTLPPAIVALKHLNELSLRDNPLVVRFVSDINYNPPSLMELSARVLKLHEVPVQEGDLPTTLMEYLNSAHHCVNPYCKGVYFDNRVEHVKFVDFCGKYRIPLLQYLCSIKCATDGNSSSSDDDLRPSRSYLMKKVLLG